MGAAGGSGAGSGCGAASGCAAAGCGSGDAGGFASATITFASDCFVFESAVSVAASAGEVTADGVAGVAVVSGVAFGCVGAALVDAGCVSAGVAEAGCVAAGVASVAPAAGAVVFAADEMDADAPAAVGLVAANVLNTTSGAAFSVGAFVAAAA